MITMFAIAISCTFATNAAEVRPFVCRPQKPRKVSREQILEWPSVYRYRT